MSASAGSLPLLVSRFLEAHRSSDIPAFSLENALIVRLDCGGDLPLLHSFHVTNNSAGPAAPPIPLDHSPFKDLFDAGLDAVLPAESLYPLLPSGWNEAHDIQIIPLALLCSPVGFLLAPLPDGEVHAQRFQGFIHLLYGFVRDCLTEDLLQVFNRASAHQYASETELLCSLAKTAAQWLAPSRYRITNGDGSLVEEKVFFPKKASQDADQFEFPVIGDAGQYKVVFHLPGLLIKGGESPGPLHQTRPYQLRKFKCSISIPRLFSRILEDWAYPVSLPQSILRQMEDIHRKTGELIRAAGKPLPATRQAPAPEDPPFCFYRKGANTWVIRFDGENALPDTESRPYKGFEVLRFLLGRPEEYFDTIFLDKHLNKIGGNYDKEGADPSGYDPEWIKKKEQDLLEIWLEYKRFEPELKKRPKEEQLFYWQQRLNMAKQLISCSRRNLYYSDLKKCSRNAEKLSVYNDDNFQNPDDGSLMPSLPPDYNPKVRLDSIRHSINNALKVLGKDSRIYQYLDATIVRTKKGSYEHFSYEPLLASPGSPEPIYWVTSPPDEEE
ncbi:MAG: hypothetical protein HUU01_10970 [Saprospiraceae bacterium]|nr:hypothetical protein [Saprospiraceae bacterium]